MQAFVEKQRVQARKIRLRMQAVPKPALLMQSVLRAATPSFSQADLTSDAAPSAPSAGSLNISRLTGSLRIQTGDLPLLAAAVSLLFFLGSLLPVMTQWITFHMFPVSLDAFSEHDADFFDAPQHVYAQHASLTPSSQNAFQPYEMQSYTVQPGETVSGISKKFNLNMDTLISVNNIENVRSLQVGQQLSILNQDGIFYKVQRGDTLELLAQRYDTSVNALLDKNNLKDNLIHEGNVIFLPQVKLDPYQLRLRLGELFLNPLNQGYFTSGFGYRADPFTGMRRFHYGLDLAAREGTPIIAASEGRVVHVGSQALGYGQYLIIRHNNEFQTLYAHFRDINVAAGDYVRMGQKIGTVGNTGRSTGPHLHFSIIRSGKFVNPSPYLF